MFKISSLADYGLVLITHLCEGTYSSIQTLVDETHLPYATLAKLASQLEKHNLLESKEGRGGGYQLARPLGRITLKEVIEALEGPIAPVKCVADPGSCVFERNCAVKPHWPVLTRSLIKWADGFTVEDLVKSRLKNQNEE